MSRKIVWKLSSVNLNIDDIEYMNLKKNNYKYDNNIYFS